MELRLTLEYKDVPILVTVKKKKHYLTANAIYAGVHFTVRTKIVNVMKCILLQYANVLKQMPPGLFIEYTYISSKKSWDVANKLFLWDKVFSDMLKPANKNGLLGVIKEDSVEYIKGVKYEGVVDNEAKGDCLIIKIYY